MHLTVWRHTRATAAAIVGASLTLAVLSAQHDQGQPAAVFKASANYVVVDALVTNAQGHFIRSLNQDDFEVLEDGKPQKVELFSLVDLPATTVAAPDDTVFAGRRAANDVRSNAQTPSGRVYVIVLDDLNTSRFREDAVIRTARRFVQRNLQSHDLAAVVYTSGRTDAQQDFTSEPALLLAAVDKFGGRKLRSYTLEKIDFYLSQLEANRRVANEIGYDRAAANAGPMPGTNTGSQSYGYSTNPLINPNTRGDGYADRSGDSEDMERGRRALGVLTTLRDLADFTAAIPGRRKALLLFSEGIDYATQDIFSAQEATAVVRAMQDVIAAAARGNVAIFGIDPRGLVGMAADAVGELTLPASVADTAGAGASLPAFAAEMRLSQDSLQVLSEETGGFASVSANDPDPFLDRVVNANSAYYLLGYRAPNRTPDGRFHKIEVRVRHAGARVAVRKGYADPRKPAMQKRRTGDSTSVELRGALDGPIEQRGIPIAVQAIPFRSTANEASVALAIEADASAFRFEPRGDNATVLADRVELSYFALDRQSRPTAGMRHEVEVALKAEAMSRLRQINVRMNPRLSLRPGRHQLRIGVRDGSTGAVGTVFCDLDVPDFTKDALSISGLLLTAPSSRPTLTILTAEPSGSTLPGPATTTRTFTGTDQVSVYVEVYAGQPLANSVVTLTTRLIGEDGREIFAAAEPLAVPPATNNLSTLPVMKRIALKGLAPGRYVLQIEAQSRGRDPRTVSRETMITVQ